MTEQINSPNLSMVWSSAPWDEAVCGFPVIQITSLRVLGTNASEEVRQFERARDELGVGLVSCRLPHDQLKESMLLEDYGFRFVEMGYAPELVLAKFKVVTEIGPLTVSRASQDDLPTLLEIARTAFHNERFKMDLRLDPVISDLRFQNWVASSLYHPSQELQVIKDGSRIVAFFVTELLNDGTCYWHLNAISPNAQGQGYGRRVWLRMIKHASDVGAQRVRTSIAARNNRVLNLYARIGFSFPPPSMTFHWVKTSFNRH